MRLIEIGGLFINPDRVAYLRGNTTMAGTEQTSVHFSGVKDDEVRVALPVSQVAKLLMQG